MQNKRVSSRGSQGRLRPRVFAGRSITALLVLLGVMSSAGKVASMEIPPEVEKKAVSLKKTNLEAERLFAARCRKCHKAPDPAKPGSVKPECSAGSTKDDLARVQNYMVDVRAGRGLYETYCSRCHALIEPGSHTFDYWSKNICTSDSCIVPKRLNGDEEQQLLLYLSSHAGEN
jgi:cytochrome c5